FQAEDGIRDYKVTGVQTCALPIYWPGLFLSRSPAWCVTSFGTACQMSAAGRRCSAGDRPRGRGVEVPAAGPDTIRPAGSRREDRSEERRVGEGGRGRW